MQKQTKPSGPEMPSEGRIIREPGTGRGLLCTVRAALPDGGHFPEGLADAIQANCTVHIVCGAEKHDA
jgi:hypothetical protein